jgi:hypothetical protein
LFNFQFTKEANIVRILDANGITQATPTCFSIAFVIAFGEIFLKYSWNVFEKVFEKIFKF